MDFDESFGGKDLDPRIWTTSYLPAWSARAESAATYRVADGELTLSIPADQGLWCEDLHQPPLRVSAVQSGNWSGPAGSGRGQSPFRQGLVVREEQPAVLGFTPQYGIVEVTCRALIGPSAMFSAWMIGIEDEPDRCGEICLVEVFGDTIRPGEDGDLLAGFGAGVHAFRDPALAEDFDAPVLPLDVARWHTYGASWGPSGVDFLLDGTVHRHSEQSPSYPLQLIIGVFEFPARRPGGASGDASAPVPQLGVRRVTGRTTVR